MARETLLARTLVQLADTLVDDFDVVDLLTLLAHRCVEMLDVSAAGLMLVAPEGDLRVVASSSEEMRVVELFELQSQDGPCPDCYRTGEPALHEDLAGEDQPWARFGPVALAAGFRSVHALPMRLRGVTIGALNLFRTETGSLNADDVLAAQALADIATIAILQNGRTLAAHELNAQLESALASRIVIEQAKGMIAERRRIPVDDAFTELRSHARNHNLRLADVARSTVAGTLDPSTLVPPGA